MQEFVCGENQDHSCNVLVIPALFWEVSTWITLYD